MHRFSTAFPTLPLGLVVLALLLSAPGTGSGDDGASPAVKRPSETIGPKSKQPESNIALRASLDEKDTMLRNGLLKLTEAQVLEIMGPPHEITRRSGDELVDVEFEWSFETYIRVKYTGGKVDVVYGRFSEALPVDRVTPQALRKLQPGMSENEVVAILGDGYSSSTVSIFKSGDCGAFASFKAGISKDGHLVRYERSLNRLSTPRVIIQEEEEERLLRHAEPGVGADSR